MDFAMSLQAVINYLGIGLVFESCGQPSYDYWQSPFELASN